MELFTVVTLLVMLTTNLDDILTAFILTGLFDIEII